MRESHQRADIDIDLLHLALERRIEEVVEDSKSRMFTKRLMLVPRLLISAIRRWTASAEARSAGITATSVFHLCCSSAATLVSLLSERATS